MKMPNTSITNYGDLPDHLRSVDLYPYLNSHHLTYWRHAVDVAHQLLDNFEKSAKEAPSDWYYQYQFKEDFKATLAQTQIDTHAQLLGPFELQKPEKDDDPAWADYRSAMAALKHGPRGTAIVRKFIYCGESHYEASVHCGGGYVNDCETLPRTNTPPSLQAIWDSMLDYEGYVARSQAEREKEILRRYKHINALNLQPGTRLRDVEIFVSSKRRKLSFVVANILDNGKIQLGKGKLRGSEKIFEVTIDPTKISANNVKDQKKQRSKAKEQAKIAPLSAQDRKQLIIDAANVRATAVRKSIVMDAWDEIEETAAAKQHFELGCWLFYYSNRISQTDDEGFESRVDCMHRLCKAGINNPGYKFFTVFNFGERQFDTLVEMGDADAVISRVRSFIPGDKTGNIRRTFEHMGWPIVEPDLIASSVPPPPQKTAQRCNATMPLF